MFDVLAQLPFQLFVALAAAGVGLVLYAILTQAEERASARSTLRQLNDYQFQNERERELLAPLQQRLVAPVLTGFGRVGRRFNPPEYVESVRRKHVRAGIATPEAVERFLAVRVLGFAFIPLWLIIVLVVNPLGFAGILKWLVAGIGVVAGAMGPASRLDSKVKSREQGIQRALPDVLDLLVISVEAGLGFEQAVDRVIANVPGELADEFARVLGETQAGASRADALRSMQERVDVAEIRSFVLAMIQADTFGVSIGRVLRAQADEMRIKRRQLAQEKAQKAPVKMMIPMVLCIFPALFVVVIGPAVINISKSF
ncbi:MAG: type II secretion system F family protein [Acidimicrobiales bacterium]